MSKEMDPRSRIEEAAKGLFARQGYAGTGVREIARLADVNLAMINYYFGSKQGLLAALTERFFDEYHARVSRATAGTRDIEATLRAVVHVVMGLLLEEPDLARVAFLAHPVDHAERNQSFDVRAHQVQRVLETVLPRLLSVLKPEAAAKLELAIVGPAIPGLLLSHMLLRPVAERVLGQRFDETFYETFPDKVADFLLFGLAGMVGDLSSALDEAETDENEETP